MRIVVCCSCHGKLSVKIIVCRHLKGKPVSLSVSAVKVKPGSWGPLSVAIVWRSWARGDHCLLPLFGEVGHMGIVSVAAVGERHTRGYCCLMLLSREVVIIECCCHWGKPSSWGSCLLRLFGEVGHVGIIVCCHCWGKTDSWVLFSIAAVGVS